MRAREAKKLSLLPTHESLCKAEYYDKIVENRDRKANGDLRLFFSSVQLWHFGQKKLHAAGGRALEIDVGPVFFCTVVVCQRAGNCPTTISLISIQKLYFEWNCNESSGQSAIESSEKRCGSNISISCPSLSAIVIESDRFGNRVVLNEQTRYGGFMLCLSEFYASIVDIIYMSRLGCLKFAPSSPPNAAYVRPHIEARRRCDILYSEKSQTWDLQNILATERFPRREWEAHEYISFLFFFSLL